MKTILLFLFLGIFTHNIMAQNQALSEHLPAKYTARIQSIYIKNIALNLRFNWKEKQAYGTASITFSPIYTLNAFTLDAGMLHINSVTLPSGIPLKFTYNGGDSNDCLHITLDKSYTTKQEITVVIDYHTTYLNEADPNNLAGSFGKGIRFFEPTFTEPNKRKQIWSMGEPEGNRYWFPCFDSPNHLRTTEFIATVEKDLLVISNGSLISTKDNMDGTHTFHWKMDIPYPNHLTSFIVGNYTDIKQQYKYTQLHNYGYPDELEGVVPSVDRLPDMVRYFSEVTGVVYPYPSYSQVFVQDFAGFAGNTTVSTITENMIDDDRTHDDFYYLWDLTEAEALASQWFGSFIACKDWSHVWLNRSFAHYFNCLYSEHKNGKDEYLLYTHYFDLNSLYLNDWKSGYRHPVVTEHFDDMMSFVADNYPVGRGSLVLHMLRKHLGEEKWWKSIRKYCAYNAHKLATTEDFLKAVNAVSDEKMDWFFEQWLYKMGHPVFEVTKRYDEQKQQLILSVKQTQAIDTNTSYPQVELFRGKVDIEIDGRIEHVWLESKAVNEYSFSSQQEPKLVNFDYESTWIKEMKFEKTIVELIYQFENDSDILGRYSAMTGLVSIASNKDTPEQDVMKIYASFRNVLRSNCYWRIKFIILPQLRILLTTQTGNNPAKFDGETISLLVDLIRTEKPWVRTSALNFLGMTKDPQYDEIYLKALTDQSDRVINAAATALGKCKSPKAFDALEQLVQKPSWKNQSLISALNGLKELGDSRGVEIAFKALQDRTSAHWTLATPVWDYRLAAAQTLVALGKADTAYAMIAERFRKSIEENDVNDIFSNVLLLLTLGDSRGIEVIDSLKVKFKDDANAMNAITYYEGQFKQIVKN